LLGINQRDWWSMFVYLKFLTSAFLHCSSVSANYRQIIGAAWLSYGAAWLSHGAAWLSYGAAWLSHGAAWLSYGAAWLSWQRVGLL
jgi:hypothetical protein